MPLRCGPKSKNKINKKKPKADQSWVFIERTDVEAETPILWPPDAKSWLIWKDTDAGKDWGQEEKGTTEDEMVGWHHWVNGHGFGWPPAVGDGQGGLVCCGSWGPKELDTTEWLNWTELNPLIVEPGTLTPSARTILLSSTAPSSGSRLPLGHPELSQVHYSMQAAPLPKTTALLHSCLVLQSRQNCKSVQFSIAAITDYDKCCGLKQHKHAILQSRDETFFIGITELKAKCWQSRISSRGSGWGLGGKSVPSSCPLLEKCIPCFWGPFLHLQSQWGCLSLPESYIPLIPFYLSSPSGEGNGNPLHYPCLENPMDGGAW